MEPLTTINLGSCKWLGMLVLAGTAAAELMSLAHDGKLDLHSFVGRELARRAQQSRAR